MTSKIENYIYGSLVGLIKIDRIENISNHIIINIEEVKTINDIERIIKGILVPNVDEEKERQAVRVAKDIAVFIYNN